jgi:hypothetical protein
MSLSAERIEEIVRQVLQELQAGRTAPSASAASPVAHASRPAGTAAIIPAAAASAAEVAAAGSGDAVLRITDRAVTEAVLEAAGAAGRTVSLVRGAVLTPSGRDFVRRHNVRLSSFVAGMSTAASAVTPLMAIPGILIVCGRETTARSAAAALNWTVREAADEFAAVQAAQDVLPERRVVCAGCEPAIAACLLNRNRSVRAAVLERAHGMEQVLERMQPHAVCLQASGWSLLQLTRLLERLQRPVRQPAGWVEVQTGAVQ